MSVKELYRAFVEGKRVKGKVILSGFIEGVLSRVYFEKNKAGQVVCCGTVEDDNGNSNTTFLAEDIFEVISKREEVRSNNPSVTS